MTEEQKYKLNKAIGLIEGSLNHYDYYESRAITIWLSVAGDYCKDVAEELRKIGANQRRPCF